MKMLRGLRRRHYACFACDVPWGYVTWSERGKGRSPEKHYDTMTLDEIAAMPVEPLLAENVFCFFWITGPFLAKGAHLQILPRWGLDPVAIHHTWFKPVRSRWTQGQFFLDDETLWKMGNGYGSRKNEEFVILATRGSPKRLSASIRSPLVEPAREHSRKPEEFYRRVEKFCAGPRLELFARTPRAGWTCRGDQMGMFDAT